MTDRMDAFVAETEEDLITLSNSLLDLERERDDETVEEVFRTAHTVKGSFAAMGFNNASDVAHALEDVLDAIRSGEIEPDPNVIDELFEGVDALEDCLSEIKSDGETGSYDGVVEGLRDLAEEGAEAERETEETQEEAPEEDVDEVEDDGEDGGDTTREKKVLIVKIRDDDFPGVAATAALDDLEDMAEVDVLETKPDRGDVEDGDYDEEFQVIAAVSADFELDGSEIRKAGSVTVVEDEVGAVESPEADEREEEEDGSGAEKVEDEEVDDVEEQETNEDEGGVELVGDRKVILVEVEADGEEDAEKFLGKLRENDVDVVDTVRNGGEGTKLNAVGVAPEGFEATDSMGREADSLIVVEDDIGILTVPDDGAVADDETAEEREEAEETDGEEDTEEGDVVTTRLRVEMPEDDFPGVAATAALDDLEDMAEVDVLETKPDRGDVEDGDYDDGFEVVVETNESVDIDGSEIRKAEEVVRSDSEGREETVEESSDETAEKTVLIEVSDDEFPGVAATAALDDIDEKTNAEVVETEPARDAVEEGEFDGSFAVEVSGPPEFRPDASDLRKVESVTVLEDDADLVGSSEESEEEETVSEETTDEETDEDTEEAEETEEEKEEQEAEEDSVSNDEAEVGSDEVEEESAGSDGSDDDDEEAIQNVRVGVDQLDEMMNNVSELVINKIQIQHAAESGDLEEVRKAADKLDKLSERIRDNVMQARLVPLKKITGRYPRVVRDVARKTGKEVDFTVKGEDIELDRSILEDLRDPIVHLLKNAVDHGLEPPEERLEAGKPRRGTVRLEAERFRDRVEIRVRDDGSGMEPDEIREEAVEKGVVSEEMAESMSDREVYDLVLESGFSTKEEVTGTSGRGVGMDAVKDAVRSNDGSISVSSTPGEGTVTTLTLPIDIAVVQALLVGVGGQKYAVPTKTVDAIDSARDADLETIRGRRVCVIDNEPRPLVSLPKKFSADGGETNDEDMVLHIRDSVREASIRCDEVYGQQEIVVQPFEGVLSDVKEFSGTAILGKGEVVPVVEVNEL